MIKFKKLHNKLKRYDEGGQVGMGDVMTADQQNIQGPSLQQGYGNPQSDQIAQQMIDTNRQLALSNPKANLANVSPDDVARTQQAINAGLSTTGSIKNMAMAPEEIEAVLAKNIASRKNLEQGGPKYAKEWNDKLNDLASSKETISDPSLLVGEKIPEFRGRTGLKITNIIKEPNGSHKVSLTDGTQSGTFSANLDDIMHEVKPSSKNIDKHLLR